MASNIKTMTKNDFLQQVLDMMDKRMDSLEHKIDDNNVAMNKRVDTIEGKIDTNTQVTQDVRDTAKRTNGRVSLVEKAVKKLEGRSGKKFNLEPNVIYFIALGTVILLTIIASMLKVDLRGLLR